MEHHYPSFLTITGSSGSAQTAIDAATKDARVALFTKMANEAREKAAAEKRDAFMADLRARGILKDRTPEEQAAYMKKQSELLADDGPPWLLIIGAIVAVLAFMGLLGGGLTYFIIKYADVSDISE